MSKWKEVHLPCPSPDCGSSDAYCVDEQGNGFCFSCSHYVHGGSSEPTKEVEISASDRTLNLDGTFSPITPRKISLRTVEFFGVKTTDRSWIFPYLNTEGELKAQKEKFNPPILIKGKPVEYVWNGSPKLVGLFGMHKYSSGNTITITEGEFDALAFRDLCGDYPVVSIKNGATGAVADVKKHLDYFKNFQKIYICFDNDEAGNKASLKVAELFPIGKVKIVNLRHHKDANDYLMAGHISEFKKCWWNAVDFTPAGIEAANTGGFESLFEDIDDLELFPYPYDKLNETTFGIRKGEMVTAVAGTGVGKSAFIAETAYNLLQTTDKKIGCLLLEENTKKTKLRFMSLFLNKPLHLTLLGRLAEKFQFLEGVLGSIFSSKDAWEFTAQTKKDLENAWNHVIDKKAHDGEPQLWLFNHFGSNNIDTIVSRIDSMVTGLGCEFIFLDHISIVVSDQQNADERKALDELATKLRTLVEQRNFALIIVSHLRRPGGKPHEEGGETSLADIRGTAGIGQLSDIVIGLERNGQHEDAYLRNVTKMRVLKNRFAGITGLTSYTHYDLVTGRLTEVDPEEIEKMLSEHVSEEDTDDMPVFDSTETGLRVVGEG